MEEYSQTCPDCLDKTRRYLSARRYIGALGLLSASLMLFYGKFQSGGSVIVSPPLQLHNHDLNLQEEPTTTPYADHCKLDRRFMPDGSMPLILLLSFPGSGNTWARFLIERASGIYSSSCYNDAGDGSDGEPAVFSKSDPCERQTIVTKTHGWEILSRNRLRVTKSRRRCHFDGAILIIRNPYGAILANFNRDRGGKTGYANSSDFAGGGWPRFVNTRAVSWANLTRSAVTEIRNILIVFYEDLVTDTPREVRRMMRFLQVPCDEQRIRCLTDATGSYKRKHKDLTLNPYTELINETMDQYIRNTRKLLKSYHERPLPPYESRKRETKTKQQYDINT